MKIWAYRNSVAHGARWVPEREVTEQTAADWLEIFQADEPEIQFVVAERKPKLNRRDTK